jgi:hypothetical protein
MPHLCSLTLALVIPLLSAGPARADDLTDVARNYVTARTSAMSAARRAHLPSFSRQTGLACSACHYQFLSLTPFGRTFKLKGYTLTAQQLIQERDSSQNHSLKLSPIPLVAGMIQSSLTHTSAALPETQNDVAALPQELSLFLAGQLTSKVGMFTQITYGGDEASVGVDNLDLRYASTVPGSTEVVYGFTLNNNPSVSDLWNTTPAWGWPYAGSAAAPGALASSVIDGGLEQQVLGLGAYSLIAGTVYAEFDVYRSAQQGQAAPNASSSSTISGVAPYWRVALQKDWEHTYVMLGTYGLRSRLFPEGVTGLTNTFTDIGIDAQIEQRVGVGTLIARGTWLHEKQKLDATFDVDGSSNASNTLKTFRLNSTYTPNQWVGLSAGYFQTTGTSDATLYAPAEVEGSASGNPKTNGFVGEVDINPWQNTRLGLQYVAYDKFNGGKTDYDGFGRNASDNNTLYLLAWLVF